MSKSVFTEEIKIAHTEPQHKTDPAEFRKVLENRRSVRVYENEAIPESVMRDCLELALLAPNSSNLQCWEFYWVKSPEKKEKLIEYCFSQNAARTAAELIVAVARIDKIHSARKQMLETLGANGQQVPKVVLEYYNKLVPFIYAKGPLSIFAPFKWLIFTLAGFFRVVPREPLGKNDLQLWAAKSTALACENCMLAASAHGYDTCPMEGLDSKRVKNLLNLPGSAVVVMAISVGKRKAEGIYGPRVRFPSEQFIREV
jgi:nitroreductase